MPRIDTRIVSGTSQMVFIRAPSICVPRPGTSSIVITQTGIDPIIKKVNSCTGRIGNSLYSSSVWIHDCILCVGDINYKYFTRFQSDRQRLFGVERFKTYQSPVARLILNRIPFYNLLLRMPKREVLYNAILVFQLAQSRILFRLTYCDQLRITECD